MDTVTTAYSRRAMRSLLALDQRQRIQAVAALEALAEREIACRGGGDTAEQNGEAGDGAYLPRPAGGGGESAGNTGAAEIGADPSKGEEAGDATRRDGAGAGNTGAAEIDMVAFAGNGELHLVRYSDTGDLVVAMKDSSITVMALIDVMQGLKRGADHD